MISRITLALLGLALAGVMFRWPNQMSWWLMVLVSLGGGALFGLRQNRLEAKSSVTMEDEGADGSWVSLLYLAVVFLAGLVASLYNGRGGWISAGVGLLNIIPLFVGVKIMTKSTEQPKSPATGSVAHQSAKRT